jgi:hypothetical protein
MHDSSKAFSGRAVKPLGPIFRHCNPGAGSRQEQFKTTGDRPDRLDCLDASRERQVLLPASDPAQGPLKSSNRLFAVCGQAESCVIEEPVHPESAFDAKQVAKRLLREARSGALATLIAPAGDP